MVTIQTSQHIVQAAPGGGITNPFLGPTLINLSGSDFFEGLIRALINLGLIVGVVLFVFMLIIGAIQWIGSGGDKANVEAARGRLTTAVIGLVILFALFAILSVVETFFGIDILTLDIPILVAP